MGKLRTRIRRPTGVISAPPKPWAMRIATIIGRLVDNPHSAELAVKYRDELKGKMKADQIAEAKKIYDEKKKSDPAAAAPAASSAPAAAPAAAPKGGNRKK